MSTAYIYNAMKGCLPDGRYETREDPKTGETQYGITLYYAGLDWWFPYQQVTPIPNYALCEVDHDKTTPNKGETGSVRYRNEFVDGQKIAHELLETQIPIPNKDMGIHVIEGKNTGNVIVKFSGTHAETLMPMMTEVPEKVATKAEIARAEEAALEYKKANIADYFQSKRERMTGGQGRNRPDPITRVYMEELNVQDVDDVTTHQKSSGGIDYEMLAFLMEQARKGAEVSAETLHDAVEKVRRSNKAQLSPNQVGNRRQSLGLAENKAKWEAEHPEEAETEA